MPTVTCDRHADVRIAGDFRAAELIGGRERIVIRRDDRRRHGDAIDDALRTRAMVAVRRVAESMMRRRLQQDRGTLRSRRSRAARCQGWPWSITERIL
jgi:hypothetical protein